MQIALIVGAILSLAFFDPLGMFRSKKKSLANSTISVESIKKIGQYISAEYYGEVLTSLQETRLQQARDTFLIKDGEFKAIKNAFLQAILELNRSKSELDIKWPRKARKVQKVFYDNYQNISESPLFQTFISEMSGNKEKEYLKKLVLDINDTITLRKDIDARFKRVDSVLEKKLKEQLDFISADKKLQKSQIVVLARGWVKAGFDFERFDVDNFSYDEEKGIIHLINIKPEILHCDINPWFIPEERIKGFEFVLVTKRANDPKYVKEVKSQSLVKLRQMAIKADILKKAKKNAEKNLRYFFGLVLDKPVNKVVIHDSYISYFDSSFKSDSLTVWSMQSVDSMMIKHYSTDSLEIIKLRKQLSQRSVFLSPRVGYRINRFSSQLFRVVDSTFSNGDMSWLKSERDSIQAAWTKLSDLAVDQSYSGYLPDRLDSIWYFPNEEVINTFKVECGFYEYPTLWQIKVSDQKASLKKIQSLKTKLSRKVYEYLLRKKMEDLLRYEMTVSQQINTVLRGKTILVKDERSKELYDKLISIDGNEEDSLRTEKMPSIIEAIDQDFVPVTSSDTKSIEELNLLANRIYELWESQQFHAVALRDTLLKMSKNADKETLFAYPRYYTLYRNESSEKFEYSLNNLKKEIKAFRDTLNGNKELDSTSFSYLENNLKGERIWYSFRIDQSDLISKTKLSWNVSWFRQKRRKKLLRQAYKLSVFEFMIDESLKDLKKVRSILTRTKEEST